MTDSRKNRSQYFCYFLHIKGDATRFSNYCRMSIETFNYILSKISDNLLKNWCNFHKEPILPEEQFVITLRLLCTGMSYSDIEHTFGISQSEAGTIFGDVVTEIWYTLGPIHMPQPNMDILFETAIEFQNLWSIPHCVGTLDVCHMRIKKPAHSNSLYFNYKKFHSITLQALVDANLRFISIDVGGFGSQHDANTFRNSTLFKGLKWNVVKLPPDEECFGIRTPVLPYFIIADGAYPLSRNLIKPYSGNDLEPHQTVFNRRISRARMTVERAFGRLKRKWHIFETPIEQDLEKAVLIIQAACVLHNIIIEKNIGKEMSYDPSYDEGYIPQYEPLTGDGQWVRDALLSFFLQNPVQ
ncbi:protein ALP1-like [Trichogramma pretiosum]|uniref:protein ALP1-like n=1 Tax=Trichogramma pretiosum TaxID=7493 RepID=UPI0006C99AC3|nr:protein ALP1-like [Trichogramma pretiosum]